MTAAPALRTLYTVGEASDEEPFISTLLLYTATGVEPPLADVAGGTALTITGEGFADAGAGLQCQFSDGRAVPATLRSASAVECAAPQVAGGGPAWEAVEVRIVPWLPARGAVRVQRTPSPAPTGLSPARGYYAEPQWVEVRGAGFVGSAYLSCRFGSGNASRVAHDGVRFVSAAEVHCRRPALGAPTSPQPLAVEVSNDGQAFVPAPAGFVVLGPARALEWAVGRVRVPAGELSAVPGLALYSVDAWGRRLLRHDPLVLPVALLLAPDPSGPAPQYTGGAAELRDGAAELPVELVRPPVGRYELRVDRTPGFAAAGLAAPEPVVVDVVEGAPAALRIVRQPSNETSAGAGALPVQPVVEMQDAAGNRVRGRPELRLHAHLEPLPPQSAGPLGVASAADGRFEFAGLAVPAAASGGRVYHLRFGLAPPAAAVPAVVSRAIRVRLCAPAQFYREGDAACAPCPRGAVCDGAAVVSVPDGYWLPPGGAQVVKCPAGTGEGALPCLAGAPGAPGGCAPGHAGLFCAVCAPGHAGDGCEPCGASPWPGLSVLGFATAFLALLAYAAWQAYTLDPEGHRSLVLPLSKRLLVYCQLLYLLQPLLPHSAGRTLAGVAAVLSLRPPAAGLRCVAGAGTLGRLYAAMALPVVGLLVALAVFGVLRLRRRRRRRSLVEEFHSAEKAGLDWSSTWDGQEAAEQAGVRPQKRVAGPWPLPSLPVPPTVLSAIALAFASACSRAPDPASLWGGGVEGEWVVPFLTAPRPEARPLAAKTLVTPTQHKTSTLSVLLGGSLAALPYQAHQLTRPPPGLRLPYGPCPWKSPNPLALQG